VFILRQQIVDEKLDRLNVFWRVNALVHDFQWLRKSRFALFNDDSPPSLRAVSIAPSLAL
jgi:hypothetical protein